MSSPIGSLHVDLGLNAARFEKGMGKATKRLRSLRTQFVAVSGAAVAMGSAITTAALAGARKIDDIAKAARRLDSSIGAFRALELAASEAGVSLSALTNDIQTINRELASIGVSGNGQRALDALGLSLTELEGLDADEKVATIADRVKELGLTSGATTALLRDLGVRNREMSLLVLQGGDAIRAARKDISDYGLAISSVDAARIEQANDRISRLGLIGQYAGQQLAITLVPALGKMAQAMTDSLKAGGLLRTAIDGFVGSLHELAGVALTVTAFFGVRYVGALVAAKVATLTFAGAAATLKKALLSSGIGAVVVGAGILVGKFGELVVATGGFGKAFSLVKDVAVEAFSRIGLVSLSMGQEIKAVFSRIVAAGINSAADVVQGWLEVGNRIAAVFAGSYKAAIAVWNNLPESFRIIAGKAMDALIEKIETGLSGVTNAFNHILPDNWKLPAPDLSDWKSGVTGDALDVGADVQAAFAEAFSTDYVNESGITESIRDAGAQLEITADTADRFGDVLRDAAKKPLKSVEAMRDALAETQQEIVEAGEASEDTSESVETLGDKTGGASSKLKNATSQLGELAKVLRNGVTSAIDGAAQAFGDWVSRGFQDFKSLTKGILSSFQRLVSDLIKTAIANPIKLSLGLVQSPVGGVGSAGGAGGLIGNAIGGFGKSGSFLGLGGLGGGTGFLGGLGNAVSGGFGNLFSVGANAAAAGGGLAASLGAAVPVIGGVVAAISFFKKKVKDLDAGLRVAVEGLQRVTVETFKLQQITRFWGLSKKTRETVSLAEAEVANPIQSAIRGIGNTVTALAATIGIASTNLDNATFDFEVSTKGKSEAEIQSAISSELDRLGDSFTEALFGTYTELLPDQNEIDRIERELAGLGRGISAERDPYGVKSKREALEQQRVAAETAIVVTHVNDAFADLAFEGEGALDTLQRIVGDLGAVNEAMELFGRSALDLSLAGAGAAAKLVELSGGLEAFSEKTQFVFDNFLTDAARDARLTELALARLNSTFGDLAFAIPETHAEFMALLDAQNLNTEAGRQTYSALSDVAQAFIQVKGTAQGAAEGLASAAAAARDARSAAVSEAQAVLSARSQAANSALSEAEQALRAAFDAQNNRINSDFASRIDVLRSASSSVSDAVIDQSDALQSIKDALDRAFFDRRALNADQRTQTLLDATTYLRQAVLNGFSDLESLERALDAVADPSTDLFSSAAAFDQAFNVNTNLIDKLREQAGESLSVEEQTLRSLNEQTDAIAEARNAQIAALEQARDAQLAASSKQLGALLGIDDSVLSVADAIKKFKAAQEEVAAAEPVEVPSAIEFQPGSFGAELDKIYKELLGRGVRQAGLDFYGGHFVEGLSLPDIRADIAQSPEALNFARTNVPRFALGGNHAGGIRMVGERGRELEVTGPARYFSNSQTEEMLDNRVMVSELRELNQRVGRMQREVRSQARILRSWEEGGQPPTREDENA